MEFIREKIKAKPISKRRIAMNVGIAVLCGLVFAAVVCVVLMIAVPIIVDKTNGTDTSRQESEQRDTQEDLLTEGSEDTEAGLVLPPDLNLSINDYQTLQDELYKIGSRVNKSIVTVMAVTDESDWTTNDFEAQGQGAGLIVASDQNYVYILTERRIIQENQHIRVSFVDGASARATLFQYDGNTGLSVLTVEKRLIKESTRQSITVAQLGSSYTIENGALVIALGSPLGTSYSILTGNITSVGHEIMTKDKNYSVFTTDIIASERGSGVLINTYGEVIGIVMQSYSGSQNMSTLTAVDILELKTMIENLKNGKDVPYVGVYISTITDEIAEEYSLPKGIFIKEVVSDSPAMKAGIQNGDVITHINGTAITTDEEFSEKISQLLPGTTCEIAVKRQSGNEYYDVQCTVTIGVLE